MFHFASPLYLLLLALPVVLVLQRRQAVTLPYSQVAQIRPSRLSWRLRIRPYLPWLRALGLTLLILALARPRWGQQTVLLTPTDTEIVLALDISPSMRAQDLTPQNRLGAAQAMLADLIAVRPYDRIGLVAFAGDAFVQTPPTRNHAEVLHALSAVSFADQLGVEDGTALGLGLATAAGLLAQSAAPNRLVVLLTDGASTDQRLTPLVAAKAAADADVRVHTVGIGQPGLVPFPQSGPDGVYTAYWESPLDEAVLHEIAAVTGGSYTRAQDDLSMQRVVTAVAAAASARSQPPQILTHQRDLFPWLLALGLGLLLLEMALRQRLLHLPGGRLG